MFNRSPLSPTQVWSQTRSYVEASFRHSLENVTPGVNPMMGPSLGTKFCNI